MTELEQWQIYAVNNSTQPDYPSPIRVEVIWDWYQKGLITLNALNIAAQQYLDTRVPAAASDVVFDVQLLATGANAAQLILSDPIIMEVTIHGGPNSIANAAIGIN